MASVLRLSTDPALRAMPFIRLVLAAETIAQCHAALAKVARQLEPDTAPLICEIALSPQGWPAILWQSAAFPEDQHRAFQDWYERAVKAGGRLHDGAGLGSGLVVWDGRSESAAYIGILFKGTPPAWAFEDALRDFAEIAARHVGRLRRDDEIRRRQDRLDSRRATYAGLLQTGSDLLWEAEEDGALRVTHIFNDRADLARLFQGKALGDLMLEDGTDLYACIRRGKPLRHALVDFRDGPHNGPPLFLTVGPRTALPHDSAPYHGAISARADNGASRPATDAVLLENMVDARAREEELRRETESMLLGLRVLLGGASFREKLEQLAGLLAGAIRCGDVRLFQHRPGEAPRLLLPPQDLPPDSARAAQRIVALGDMATVTVLPAGGEDCLLLRHIMGRPKGDIALVALPFRAERLYLLCGARPTMGFSARDLAFTERFTLLLQQAILLRDEQDQMVHTAKLSALGQMSTSIAHELRQPLNTISITAQTVEALIERGELTPELLQEKIARILRQVDRSGKVMDRMRRFGRKSAGDHKVASLVEIVQSARAFMEHVTQRTGTSIEIAVPEWQQVFADELEIEQVLVNLIQNAIDAIQGQQSPPRGKLTIRSSPHPDESHIVCLHVEDNGPGFTPDVRKHALDAFFTTKSKTEGTGLGLSISHAILREHGGRLELGNWDGGGSVTLFLRQPENSATIIPMDRNSVLNPNPGV